MFVFLLSANLNFFSYEYQKHEYFYSQPVTIVYGVDTFKIRR
jgi:hypothetical protein